MTPARSRLTAAAATAVCGATIALCGALLIGCGASAQDREARALEATGVLSNTAPLGDRLVSQSEINSASDKDGERTFLRLWSLLQYGAVDRASLLFEPELRRAIGTPLLAGALAGDLLIWQGTKPRIVSVSGSPPTATIMFQARDETNKLLPGSITLRGREGHWQVAYFSPLNFALQRAVQQRVQGSIEPLATKPSAEAVRQGDAASAIQTNYLEHLLRSEAPAKP